MHFYKTLTYLSLRVDPAGCGPGMWETYMRMRLTPEYAGRTLLARTASHQGGGAGAVLDTQFLAELLRSAIGKTVCLLATYLRTCSSDFAVAHTCCQSVLVR